MGGDGMSAPSYRFTRWLQRHRLLARLLPRRLVSRLVWGEIGRDPEFMASIARGQADIAAGRLYIRGDGPDEWVRGPNWPKDDIA